MFVGLMQRRQYFKMKIVIAEIKKTFAEFAQHYIQYTILTIIICALVIIGIYSKYENYSIGMYDRLMYFNLIFYLLIIRMVSNGLSVPFSEITREKDENKLLSNISISKYNTWQILMSRILIKGIISMALSLLVVFALIIMFGIYFSYKNYLLLIFYYFLSTIMLYGISFAFTGINILFDLQKQVSIVFELAIIVYLILAPLNHYNGFSYFKSFIYSILFNDIIHAEVTNTSFSQIMFSVLVSILFLVIGYFYTISYNT